MNVQKHAHGRALRTRALTRHSFTHTFTHIQAHAYTHTRRACVLINHVHPTSFALEVRKFLILRARSRLTSDCFVSTEIDSFSSSCRTFQSVCDMYRERALKVWGSAKSKS